MGSEVYVGGKNFGAFFASMAFEDLRASNSSLVSVKGYVFNLFTPEEPNKYELIEDISQILNDEQFKNEFGLDESDIWNPYFSSFLEHDQFTYEHLLAFTEKNSNNFNTVISGRDLTVDDLKFE